MLPTIFCDDGAGSNENCPGSIDALLEDARGIGRAVVVADGNVVGGACPTLC